MALNSESAWRSFNRKPKKLKQKWSSASWHDSVWKLLRHLYTFSVIDHSTLIETSTHITYVTNRFRQETLLRKAEALEKSNNIPATPKNIKPKNARKF